MLNWTITRQKIYILLILINECINNWLTKLDSSSFIGCSKFAPHDYLHSLKNILLKISTLETSDNIFNVMSSIGQKYEYIIKKIMKTAFFPYSFTWESKIMIN